MNKTYAQEDIFFYLPEKLPVKITVTGIGGMGNNFAEHLAKKNVPGLDLYSINTDQQALESCCGSHIVQIGKTRCQGRGAGSDPVIGRKAAEDDIETIREILTDTEVVFVAAGMGGGTGTGGAPVIAGIGKEMNKLVIGIVTTPMFLEGRQRLRRAEVGIRELEKNVDCLIKVSNNQIGEIADNDISIWEVFRRTDEILLQGVIGVSQIITTPGYINVDLADIKSLLKKPVKGRQSSSIFIGNGRAAGRDRATKSLRQALENPLLPDFTITGAENLLVNVAGSASMKYKEAEQIFSEVAKLTGKDEKELFIGIVKDESMGDEISVTIIATGFTILPTPLAAGNRKTPTQLDLYDDFTPAPDSSFSRGINAGAPPAATYSDSVRMMYEQTGETPLSVLAHSDLFEDLRTPTRFHAHRNISRFPVHNCKGQVRQLTGTDALAY